MSILPRQPLKKGDLLWILVSLIVLFPVLYYPYVKELHSPDFQLNPIDWRVLSVAPCAAANCLKVGDQVLSIGQLDLATFSRQRGLELLAPFDERGSALVRVLRRGEILSFPVRAQGPAKSSGWYPPAVLFPLVFWLMGTVAILFLRPRDERWLVLVAFSYVTAVWLAAGFASSAHLRGSAIVFHAVIWFFMPLTVHLHLILPSSLLDRRARVAVLMTLYASASLLVVVDGFYLLAQVPSGPFLFTVAGILVSLGLILLRLFLPLGSAQKLANRIMLFGLLLGLGPFIFFFGLLPLFQRQLAGTVPDLWKLYPWLVGSSLLSLPMLPMSYIYAIYKHHLGALEFRANRLLGLYGFLALSITAYVMVLFLVGGRWGPLDERLLTAVLTVSLLFAVGTPLLRAPFQKLIDRHVFGIRHTPEEVIDLVSARVPLAFDREVLARLLVEEILPTLFIRQSALYLFAGRGHETLCEQGLPAAEPPVAAGELRALLERGGRYLPPLQGEAAQVPRSWVRLVIPLAVQSEIVGVWLIGRRDPDDYFPAIDIRLLSTVANQIAPMVENIRLYERAQREIAQRTLAEEEIRRSEQRFRNLFEATLEGIAIVKGGVIVEVNQALLAIFGYGAPDLIGRELTELLPEGGPTPTASGPAGAPRESIGWKRDGSVLHLEIAAKKYVLQGEDVTVVAIRDIARRKRDEAENQMLQRQLLHSQKMEAVGRLSAGVAHDFNNCLLAIFGYSDLLLERYGGDPFLQRNLSGIQDASQKAASLTRQLLTFARRQPMETKVVNLNSAVAGVEKMLRRLLGDDVSLITDLHRGVGQVKIDPGKFDQVVVNLAVNARQAMPAGGRLTIRTSPIEVAGDGAPLHADVPPGSYVLLTVSDTGVGMDLETQARAFEPFFSTKGEGTGLGLATAYGIVRQSGGQIFVDSAPGEGTRFRIYLPVTIELPSRGTEAAASAAETGSENILLVEDEDGVRAVLTRILANRGYRVLAATGADEALDVARRNQGGIDLLLTDVTMPRMRGPELARTLLAEQPRMRVLYMSGYNEGPLPAGAGAPICLQKPFSAQTLARTVRKVLDGPLVPQPAF
ncbi:MAG TPA: ATP-binding protein [Thermoanaerobaculia bacterium]|nr:ATP-binding protein [Thermoanaerobaculia bacterium]